MKRLTLLVAVLLMAALFALPATAQPYDYNDNTAYANDADELYDDYFLQGTIPAPTIPVVPEVDENHAQLQERVEALEDQLRAAQVAETYAAFSSTCPVWDVPVLVYVALGVSVLALVFAIIALARSGSKTKTAADKYKFF